MDFPFFVHFCDCSSNRLFQKVAVFIFQVKSEVREFMEQLDNIIKTFSLSCFWHMIYTWNSFMTKSFFSIIDLSNNCVIRILGANIYNSYQIYIITLRGGVKFIAGSSIF